MEIGVVMILGLLLVAYLLLGVLTTEVVLEGEFREIPRKYRPLARLFSVTLWPVVLVIGMAVSGITFVFKEWFD